MHDEVKKNVRTYDAITKIRTQVEKAESAVGGDPPLTFRLSELRLLLDRLDLLSKKVEDLGEPVL